jgi:hypothetical protein
METAQPPPIHLSIDIEMIKLHFPASQSEAFWGGKQREAQALALSLVNRIRVPLRECGTIDLIHFINKWISSKV